MSGLKLSLENINDFLYDRTQLIVIGVGLVLFISRFVMTTCLRISPPV